MDYKDSKEKIGWRDESFGWVVFPYYYGCSN